MTDREQLLTIVAGRHPDRFPWISRFQIWYGAQVRRGTLPEQYWGQACVPSSAIWGWAHPRSKITSSASKCAMWTCAFTSKAINAGRGHYICGGGFDVLEDTVQG